MDYNQNTPPFNQAGISDIIGIWERAAISLMDIRHNLITSDQALQNYRMPASAFIYTSGAKAEVLLNDTSFRVERFGIFHGGKGTVLSIQPDGGWLEYYMLFYKAQEPAFHKREFLRLLERNNPFRQIYGFEPGNPLFFGYQLRLMYEKWKSPVPINLFYGKAAFYQLVYEIYEELGKGPIRVFEPDLISMARRYLDGHYGETIAIQDVCSMLGISYSHFYRRFTRQVGKSPQDYLIQARLSAAMDFLNHSAASIREISEYCGFQDERNFHRQFVKHMGMSPNQYRENMSDYRRDYTLEKSLLFPYNEQSFVSLDKLKGKGETFMFKQIQNKAVAAAAMSLMLLLSACSAAPTSSNNTAASASEITSQVTEAAASKPATRMVTTSLGDVEIPVNPQRIACHTWTGDLVALGIIPAVSNDTNLVVLQDALKGSSQASFTDAEEIMAQDPDLIIVRPVQYGDGSTVAAEDYEKIAPTIVVPYDTSLDERITFFGEIFDKQEEAQAALDAFYAKAERYTQDFKAAGIYGKSIAIVRPAEDGIMVLGDDSGHGSQVLYYMLGFKVPEIIQKELLDKGEGSKKVSWEVAANFLDADYLEVGMWSEEETVESLTQNNPIWSSIPAVQNHHVIEFANRKYDNKSLYVMDKLLDYYHEQFLQSAE